MRHRNAHAFSSYQPPTDPIFDPKMAPNLTEPYHTPLLTNLHTLNTKTTTGRGTFVRNWSSSNLREQSIHEHSKHGGSNDDDDYDEDDI